MKILGRKNYGSIPHLSTSKLGVGDHYIQEGQEKIFTFKTRDKHDAVLVFEKYDGSNVGITKINGKIFALTRAGYEAKTSPYKHHLIFDQWVQQNQKMFKDILLDGERLVGEWLLQAHGIRYHIDGRLDPIVFFDLFNKNNERYLYSELETISRVFKIPLPRLLHKGGAIKVDNLLVELNKKTYGIEASEKPEGLVYRVERKGKVDFLAKWVRNDFEAGKYCINIEEENLIYNTRVVL